MGSQHFCRNCIHCQTFSGYNGEPDQFFCISEETKQREHPIGYLREDAPSCEHFKSRNGKYKKPEQLVKIFIVHSSAEPVKASEQKKWDVIILEKSLLLCTIGAVVAFTLEHLKPSAVLISELVVKVVQIFHK